MSDRLLQLARSGAQMRHCIDAGGGGHVGLSSECPHPDCVLVRGGSAPVSQPESEGGYVHIFGTASREEVQPVVDELLRRMQAGAPSEAAPVPLTQTRRDSIRQRCDRFNEVACQYVSLGLDGKSDATLDAEAEELIHDLAVDAPRLLEALEHAEAESAALIAQVRALKEQIEKDQDVHMRVAGQ